jgi:hypothetical protein
MALDLGFQWGADGNTGAFLDAIANLSAVQIKSLIHSQPTLATPQPAKNSE